MKKISIIAISVLLLLCPFSLAVLISPGETLEDSETEIIENPSSILGGLIFNLFISNEEFISWLGLKVWKEVDVSQTQDFELVLFSVGETPQFSGFREDVIFEESEEITIGEITSTWITYTTSFEYGDLQDPMELIATQSPYTFFYDGSSVAVSGSGGVVTYYWDNGLGSSGSNTAITNSCNGGECPTEQQLLDFTGGSTISLREYAVIPELNDALMIVFAIDGNSLAVVDLEKNNEWNFSTSGEIATGKSCISQSGETLLISEAGTFDLYTII